MQTERQAGGDLRHYAFPFFKRKLCQLCFDALNLLKKQFVELFKYRHHIRERVSIHELLQLQVMQHPL